MQYSIENLKNAVGNFRLDAEAYLPIYFEIEKQIKNKKYTTIAKESIVFKKGIFDIKAECYCDKNASAVPFVRISNLRNMIIDDNDIIYIPKDENLKNKSTYLKKNDLILSKTAYPACSLVTLEQCNTSQDTIAVKLKKDSSLLSQYLVLFLNSKFGYYQMKRWFTGNIQMHLNLTDGKGIIVPILDENFQVLLRLLFEQSIDYSKHSKNLYIQSEELLLKELNLLNWQPKHKLWSVKNFSETQQAERIDAEYYQPEYDEILNSIKSYSNGWDNLGSLVNIKDKIFNPKDEKIYKYLELSNISNNGEITGFTTESGKNLPTRARRIVKTNDVIISSIEGSLESIALVTTPYNNALCSNGFYVVDSDFYNSETLLCLMKSCIGQQQLKKGCNGTILTAINKDEFSKIALPKVKDEIQTEIKNKILESYNLKFQSKQLLEIAKQGVEKAIEGNEEIATNWINQELDKIGVTL